MTFKKRLLLALSVGKAIFELVLTECQPLFGKIKFRFISLFKTPTSRIVFYCVILVLSFIVLINISGNTEAEKVGPEAKYDSLRAIVGYVGISVWLIFIAIAMLGKYQSHTIKTLKAELANKQDNPQLFKKVDFFSEKAEISTPTIYLTQRHYVTTLSAGRLNGRGILVLNSKVLELLDEDELDCVIAHEICQVKHSDSLLNIVLGLTFYLLFCVFFEISLRPINMLRESWRGVKSSYKGYEKLLYLIGLLLVVPMMTLTLMIGIPIRNIFHEQKLRADLWSSCITGNPLALKTAISKLSAFIQTPKDHSPECFCGLFNIVEPISCRWVQQKQFRFLFPRNTRRMDRLTMLDEMGIVSKLE